jgi:deoxyribodipyrimidine photo-lyase
LQTKQIKNMSAVVWFRNNLRIRDNEALTKAVKSGKTVFGLYCFDPYQYAETTFGFPKTGDFRTKFLFETLQDLKASLAKKNISLFVYHRATASAFEDLMARVPFTEVFTQKEWTTEEVRSEEHTSELQSR